MFDESNPASFDVGKLPYSDSILFLNFFFLFEFPFFTKEGR